MRRWLLFFFFVWGCGPGAPEKKFVLFEFFGRQACGICKEAGPIADSLRKELEAKGEPVLMLGYDVGPSDKPNPDLGGRRARWREVFGDKSALLPLILLQSGSEVTQGRHKDFHEKYLSMIQSATSSAPIAKLNASLMKEPGSLQVSIELTNTGPVTFDDKNHASIRLFFYDDQKTIHVAHTPRIIEDVPLSEPVSPGSELSLRLVFNAPVEIDTKPLHLAVVVEYKDSDGQWQIAQGTFAKEEKFEGASNEAGMVAIAERRSGSPGSALGDLREELHEPRGQ